MDVTEKALVIRLNENDETAFHEIYERFYNAVYHFVSQYIGDAEQVKDIVHDSFLEIWVNRDKIDAQIGYKSLIIKIARNKSLNYLRAKTNSAKHPNSVSDMESLLSLRALEDTSMDKLLYSETSGILFSIIENLPDKLKEVFLMSRKYHLTNLQIAMRMGISKKSVEYRLMCALKQIRKNFEDLNR